MITEKQFFKTFGIKPKKQCYYWDCPYSTGDIAEDTPINERDCANCTNPDKEVYPQITDRILLKLLSIQSYEKSCYTLSPFDSIDELKKDLLNEFIDGYTYDLYNDKEDVKHQVQTLFKEDA